MSNTTVTRSHDVVVVGGSQAGLAIGYHLAELGVDFTIVDAASEPAAAWRERWDSLRLFTSARYDSLPGMPFPGDSDRYPTQDEVADYLTDYARRFELPLELGSRVQAVRASDGGYLVELADRSIEADQVVIATGPFQTPFIPDGGAGAGGDTPAQHRVPLTGRHRRRPGARRRWWQHRLSDRRRVVGLA